MPSKLLTIPPAVINAAIVLFVATGDGVFPVVVAFQSTTSYVSPMTVPVCFIYAAPVAHVAEGFRRAVLKKSKVNECAKSAGAETTVPVKGTIEKFERRSLYRVVMPSAAMVSHLTPVP